MTTRIQLPPHLMTGPFSSTQADKADIARGRLRGPDIRHPFPGVNSTADAIGIVERCHALAVRMVQAGFTGLVSNLEITTRDGTVYRGDFAFPREKVIVEYQSEYHSETEQFRRDMTRIAKLQADGWFVMQVNADDLRNPRELADRIRHVLSQRAITA